MLESNLCILPATSTPCSKAVLNSKGEKIGELIDFRIDLKNRSIAYAVLSFSKALGPRNRLVALPWEALHLDPRTSCFMLDMEEKVLQNAPCLDAGNWQHQCDQEFINRIYTYYGYEPYYDETGRIRPRTYTETVAY